MFAWFFTHKLAVLIPLTFVAAQEWWSCYGELLQWLRDVQSSGKPQWCSRYCYTLSLPVRVTHINMSFSRKWYLIKWLSNHCRFFLNRHARQVCRMLIRLNVLFSRSVILKHFCRKYLWDNRGLAAYLAISVVNEGTDSSEEFRHSKPCISFLCTFIRIDLFRLYILFSQYRSCDDTQEIWSFVLFIEASMNMSACTLFNEQD